MCLGIRRFNVSSCWMNRSQSWTVVWWDTCTEMFFFLVVITALVACVSHFLSISENQNFHPWKQNWKASIYTCSKTSKLPCVCVYFPWGVYFPWCMCMSLCVCVFKVFFFWHWLRAPSFFRQFFKNILWYDIFIPPKRRLGVQFLYSETTILLYIVSVFLNQVVVHGLLAVRFWTMCF